MLFDTTYKAVTTIVNNIEKYKSNSIDDALPYLADLNIEQRAKGLNADGQLITPGLRNEAYANAKKSRGGRAPFGTPDLKDTGDFNDHSQCPDCVHCCSGHVFNLSLTAPAAQTVFMPIAYPVLSDSVSGDYLFSLLRPPKFAA